MNMRNILKRICKTILALFFFVQSQSSFGQNDPDMPNFPGNTMTKEEFMILRSEAIGVRRGIIKDTPFNPMDRILAIRKMEDQERILALNHAPQVAWTEIGPNPIPNGQVVSGSQLAVSGRTIAIAVHPTNANIVYVGTAQGGLYRTTDGGTTWTPLLDNALSLAIGSVAISPSQPETIYVGTGEPNFSSDSYFGVGIYRIDNASSPTPTITGPLGSSSFNGRSVSKIVVHPTDPATIFVSSTSGVGGIRSAATSPVPNVGVYRSTNATAASPTFTQIGVLASPNNNISVRDIAIDPSNANILLANLVANGGGIYRSANALAATPTWASIVTFSSTSTSGLTAEFAAIHPGADANATFYLATGNNTVVTNAGRVLKSTDGGATFSQINAVNFCNPQCFYNIAVDVDPTNVNNVYIGGTGANTFSRSTNGGTTFTPVQDNLHTDSHVIAVAPSSPTTIYYGSDGGIYKSTNSGTTWTSLNNATFRATQFMGIAVHPTDFNFTIGGTQDNGTEYRNTSGTWTRSDFGDGGYAVIDQNAVNTTNVNMYHTYFNSTTLAGYGVASLSTVTEGGWTFRGCNGISGNGIVCPTTVNFYAPLERGPGNPNSIYYGADRLYRSVDLGVNNATVSQTFTSAISAIGIAPSNDNVRIIGRNDGGLFGTTTGSAVLTDLDAGNTVPNSTIVRTVVAPSDVNTAYVTLSVFNVVNVWKTTNLNNANPTWTAAAGSGGTALPLVPVNAIVVAPTNSSKVFAGTDIGVYYSADGGATWNPFGTGLPRVAVFGMAITAGNVLRIATHGRGMWEITLSGVLSVKWLSVSGNLSSQKQALIGWKVNEANVMSYEIQKSADGRNFTGIGIVNSKGDGVNNYDFTEPTILQGTAFYRIKQIDKDGSPGFSSIIRLTTDPRANVTVYPNPAVDQMIVTVGRELQNTKMLLTDMAGKVLQSFTIQQLSFTFDLTSYPKGVYMLKFNGGISERIIKL